jgi:hypothetical protein
MAQKIKAGGWFYRINPSKSKELQISASSDGSYSHIWDFSSEIFDLQASGSDVIVSTAQGTFIRKISGIVEKR